MLVLACLRACVRELRAAAGVVFGQNRLLLAARFSALSPSPLTIFIAQVRKSPHVGQVYGKANHREKKVDLLGPSLSAITFTV